MLKNLFCKFYSLWLSKAVDSPEDPLVKFLDFTTGSKCKYCMAARAMTIGLGIGLFNLLGLLLIVLAILCAFAEKHWLCDIKESSYDK